MSPIPTAILLQFLGEECIWREYPSHRQAVIGLRYEKARCSWPMRLVKIVWPTKIYRRGR